MVAASVQLASCVLACREAKPLLDDLAARASRGCPAIDLGEQILFQRDAYFGFPCCSHAFNLTTYPTACPPSTGSQGSQHLASLLELGERLGERIPLVAADGRLLRAATAEGLRVIRTG